MRKSVMVAFSYIAACIGAGFASGAEVVSFFWAYGKESVIGLVLSSALFGIFSFIMLKDCAENGIYNFSEYLGFIMPDFFKRITDIVVFVFMAISLAGMSAGAGEILKDVFRLPNFWGVIIFSIICIFLLNFSVSGLTKINGALGIIIAIGMVFCCVYIINFRFLETFNSFIKITSSAISYTAYNQVASAVILCSMSSLLKTKKQAFITSCLIGAGLFVVLASLWCVVGIYYGKVDLGEIPMLSIASRQGTVFYIGYSIILFLAVLTTAISNGFGICEYLKKVTSKWGALIVILAFMIFLSGIGFSNIVDKAYRLCGYASLILPVFMVINRVKQRKLKKKEEIID